MNAVAFNPDGPASPAPARTSTIRLWDPLLWSDDAGPPSPRLRRAERSLTRAEWTEHLPGQPYRETCPGAR